ncbi:GrpB family protein [Bacillus sp. SCS-153A]|uniref:GrpB family protein n=1 Tax=Rossellomorea sedimentorum TaxID=3115294 RepID=UPI0039063028
MLGVKKGEVFLLEHSNDWGKLYKTEKHLLEIILGDSVVDIQHFGSTAISGMKAKPILDLLIGVNSIKDIEQFDTARLKQEGYYHLPRVNIEGKQVFAKFIDLESLTKTHILHVVEYEGKWWKEHITFRDYLNSHPSAAKEYEALKIRLAEEHPDDEAAYTSKKKQFVDNILKHV